MVRGKRCRLPVHLSERGAGGGPGDLFAAAPDNWRFEGWLAQVGWMFTLGHEGGLFFTIGRRGDAHEPTIPAPSWQR